MCVEVLGLQGNSWKGRVKAMCHSYPSRKNGSATESHEGRLGDLLVLSCTASPSISYPDLSTTREYVMSVLFKPPLHIGCPCQCYLRAILHLNFLVLCPLSKGLSHPDKICSILSTSHVVPGVLRGSDKQNVCIYYNLFKVVPFLH